MQRIVGNSVSVKQEQSIVQTSTVKTIKRLLLLFLWVQLIYFHSYNAYERFEKKNYDLSDSRPIDQNNKIKSKKLKTL